MLRSLPWLCVALVVACAERPSLLIRIDHPGGMDPAMGSGKLTVVVLRGDSGQVVEERKLDTSSLASKQRLFEGLDLQQGSVYQIGMVATFQDKTTCVGTGSSTDGRAVGVSPPFVYDEDLTELGIYMDCADTSSTTGSPVKHRNFHTATYLPYPAPHGQVVLAGGSAPELDLAEPGGTELHSSMESFDPALGRFKLLETKLSQPRVLHGAGVIGEGELVVTGGLDRMTLAGKHYMASQKLVERFANERVARLHDLSLSRGVHGMAILDPRRLLLVGGLGADSKPMASIELYDLLEPGAQQKLPEMTSPRTTPVVVPFSGGARVLIAGGAWQPGSEVKAEILCLSGDCPCGTAPCIHPIDSFGEDGGRFGVTATPVGCDDSTDGAIYLVGGSHTVLMTKTDVVYDDIYCLDTTKPQRLEHVGHLKKPRTAHTTTLVRGSAGKRRLLVAGGSGGDNAKGEGIIYKDAELIPVSCSCGISTDEITTLDLQGFWVGHSATALADGSVLFVGGYLSSSAERFTPDL